MDIDVLIWGIIYPCIATVMLRPLAGHFAYHWMREKNKSYLYRNELEKPNYEQWTGAIATSVMLVCIWPLVIVWMLAGKFTPSIGAEKQIIIEHKAKEFDKLQRELDLEPMSLGN